jgi:hypothetical protein
MRGIALETTPASKARQTVAAQANAKKACAMMSFFITTTSSVGAGGAMLCLTSSVGVGGASGSISFAAVRELCFLAALVCCV